MAEGGATMLVLALATTAVSAGVQIYAADQAAKSQAQIAAYNREIAQQNAQWQQMAAQRAADTAAFNAQLQMFNSQSQQMQAEFTKQASNFQNEQQRMQSDFVDMQAELQKNQAAMLRQQAAGEEEQAQEQADRIRKEKARILGLQRSQYAKGNVLSSAGSSLMVLSETADIFERQAVDTRLLANLNANKARYEAGVTDFNAGITSLEASAMRDDAALNDKAIEFNFSQDMFKTNLDLASAHLKFDDSKWEREAAGAGYRINQRQAEIEYMSGMAQSRATQMGAWSAGISGLGQMANLGLSYQGTRKTTPTYQTNYNFYKAS